MLHMQTHGGRFEFQSSWKDTFIHMQEVKCGEGSGSKRKRICKAPRCEKRLKVCWLCCGENVPLLPLTFQTLDGFERYRSSNHVMLFPVLWF